MPSAGTPFRQGDWKLGGDMYVVPVDAAYNSYAMPLVFLQNGTSYRLLTYQQEAITILMLLDNEAVQVHQVRMNCRDGSLISYHNLAIQIQKQKQRAQHNNRENKHMIKKTYQKIK
jgi:hypothetical protein